MQALFETLFIQPIINTLALFLWFFSLLKIPGAFGFSIIALTVFIRLLLHPFFKQQLETAKKMQDIKPHLDKLSVKHKKDPKKLQEEQMNLYKSVGLNPASGCLFMIIQIPVFIGLYQTLNDVLLKGSAEIIKINKLLYTPFLRVSSLDPHFFGLNLAVTPAKGGHWLYYLIPVITAALQYFQVQVSTPQTNTVTSAVEERSGKTAEVKKNDSGDFQKAMNTQMKYFFPLMIGWFSFNLPTGLALYWNIFSLFSIVQARNLKGQNLNVKSTS